MSNGKASRVDRVERKLTAFAARAKAEDRRFEDVLDSNYYVCLCFETREQVMEFLEAHGFDGDNVHVDGLAFAASVGTNLEAPRMRWPRSRINRRLGQTE